MPRHSPPSFQRSEILMSHIFIATLILTYGYIFLNSCRRQCCTPRLFFRPFSILCKIYRALLGILELAHEFLLCCLGNLHLINPTATISAMSHRRSDKPAAIAGDMRTEEFYAAQNCTKSRRAPWNVQDFRSSWNEPPSAARNASYAGAWSGYAFHVRRGNKGF